MSHRPVMRATAGSLAAVIALVGCRDRAAVRGEGPYADKVAEQIPKIERVTGLKFKQAPSVETRTAAQLTSFLERQFAESRAAKELAGQTQAYKLLGMLPDTLDVKQLYLDLLHEQVVGYYDPKTKTLYVMENAAPEAIGITVTHELIHALQDQYFNVDSAQHAVADNDRMTALQAVVEGQAVYEQLAVMLNGGNLATNLPGSWDMIRQQIREAQTTMPRLASAPLLIQETLLFPYLSGAEFIRSWKMKYPDQPPYARMPQGSEQILHPGKFLAGTDSPPPRLALPAPTGGTVTYANDLGEFEVRLFLYEHLKDAQVAARGAIGWNGDAYNVVKTATGAAIVWLTLWDTPFDAADFLDLANRTVAARYAAKDYFKVGAGGRKYTEKGRVIVVRPVTVQGIAGVLYVDAPAGAAVDIDVNKVKVTRPR